MNKSRKKFLPVGVSDFKTVVKECYFVDKTRFIAKLLDQPKTSVSLLTRPRRFGKTLFLSMISYFFAINHANENKNLFIGLEIEKFDQRYMENQGKYPVIFLSLKDIYDDTFTGCIDLFANIIARLYEEFSYILDSNELTTSNKKYFEEICERKCNNATLKYSLASLAHFLYLHHKKDVIVLIDEYDTPIIQAWHAGYYDDIIKFLRVFLGACLKDNPEIKFSLLTGVTRVSKESIFSGFNNFEVYSILSEEFSTACGFTENEVLVMMDYYNVSVKFDELKEWYDGYIFGNTEIFNPLSVIKYIKNGCIVQPYWVNTSENTIISDLLCYSSVDTRNDIENLVNKKVINKNIDEMLVYKDINTNIDCLYTLLVNAGYLKVVQKEVYGTLWNCYLQIPNKELYESFKSEICKKLYSTSHQIFDKLCRAIVLGNEAVFQDILQKIFAWIMVFRKTTI